MMHSESQILLATERNLRDLAAPALRFGATRWVEIGVAALYALIFVAAPSQITDVIRISWNEKPIYAWIWMTLPLISACLSSLCVIARRNKTTVWGDVILVNAPLAILTLMTPLCEPPAQPIMAATLLISVALTLLLRRRLESISARGSSPKIVLPVVFVYCLCVAIVQISPFSVPSAIGPLGTFTIGLALNGLLLSVASLFPIISSLYMLLCVIFLTQNHGSKSLRLIGTEIYENSEQYSFADGFYRWLESRSDLQDYKDGRRPYPIVIASAEGGGIYAAAHYYLVLGALSEACPNFSEHLFATVGVSGGSVGTLLYSAKIAPLTVRQRLQRCKHGSRTIDVSPLTADLLSPALANLLLLRTADFFTLSSNMFRDGGETLEESIASIDLGNHRLVEPLRAGWDPKGSRPLTIFVTTDVETGNRFIFTPLDDSGGGNAETFPSGNIVSAYDIPANVAAVTSARFPWLTPTARLRVSENSQRLLADGGYFENSGADTVTSLIANIAALARQTKACPAGSDYQISAGNACKCPLIIHLSYNDTVDWSGCAKHVFISYLAIASSIGKPLGYVYEDRPIPKQSYIFDPVLTMLRARTVRGQIAIERARDLFSSADDRTFAQGKSAAFGYFTQQLPVDALNLPLGWKLSRLAAANILSQSAPTVTCLERESDSQSSDDENSDSSGVTGEPENDEESNQQVERDDPIATSARQNGCEARMLASLFNLSEGKDGIELPGWRD